MAEEPDHDMLPPELSPNLERQIQLESQGWKVIIAGVAGLIRFERLTVKQHKQVLWLCDDPDCTRKSSHKNDLVKHTSTHRRDDADVGQHAYACSACGTPFFSRHARAGHLRQSIECRTTVNA